MRNRSKRKERNNKHHHKKHNHKSRQGNKWQSMEEFERRHQRLFRKKKIDIIEYDGVEELDEAMSR